MFLSQMPINTHRRRAREFLMSAQQMHAGVLGCFPPDVSDNSRILWRVDSSDRLRHDLLVVSEVPPSFDGLAEQIGWSDTPTWRSVDYERFLSQLRSGQQWVFRLKANPTVTIVQPHERRGKRIPLVKVSQQMTWLTDRCMKWGFTIPMGSAGEPNVSLSNRERISFQRHHDGASGIVHLQTVQFDGVLEITDPETLRRTLTRGVGSAKGYGCGLMTLAPVI